MIFYQALLIIFLLVLMPVCMGQLMNAGAKCSPIVWVKGLMLQWAITFLVSVPCIIKQISFSKVSWGVMGIWFAMAIAGGILGINRRNQSIVTDSKQQLSKNEILYLSLFLGIVLFQIVKAIFFAYEDGDDAYYIAVAQNAVSSETMYKHDAYTGIPTTINYRYALAPFPIWISILSLFSRINVAIISHTILPVMLLLATYVIYDEIAKVLFADKGEKRFAFLSLIAIYVMFENVSTSTAGTFLMTRARQGKEALANIILPFLFFVMLKLIKNNLELQIRDYLLIVIISVASSLTSVLANMLVPIMLFFLIIASIIKKKGFKNLFLISSLTIPNLIVILIYVIL